MNKSHKIDMTSGSIPYKLLVFSLPIIFSGILQLLFNAADIIVVGQFAGDEALAAVGSTGSLVNLLTNLFIGLSVGTNVVASHFFGAKNYNALKDTVHTAMLVSFFCGILLTLIGVTLAEQILRLMQAPENVLKLAARYLKIYFAGITSSMIYNFGSALLRAKGDTKRPLYILLISGMINVILNLLFVIFFKMGVSGVAFATVIAQTAAAIFITAILKTENDEFKLSFKLLKIDREIFIRIMKIGIPAGLQGTLFSFSNVIIQSSVNTFGAITIAGNSAAQNIEGFVYTAMNGFAQGTLTFTSQNVGAQKYDRVKKLVLISEILVTAIGLVLGFSVILFDVPVLKMYSKNSMTIKTGADRLFIICSTYFLCGMMDVIGNIIRGFGHSVLPMIVTLAGACGFRILWIATFFQIPKFHTPKTIYYSYPLSWLITFIVELICFIIIFSKVNAQQNCAK